jgi:hypothetical protein
MTSQNAVLRKNKNNSTPDNLAYWILGVAYGKHSPTQEEVQHIKEEIRLIELFEFRQSIPQIFPIPYRKKQPLLSESNSAIHPQSELIF